ncbi:MAG: hypothetical protein UU87_C0003G0160 [Parcubacteria group bacterium GW2011_GWA2_42_11]|nr:MAG: hypothetical protein UU87_C0003G0160 [Parcubacteria group bacterium GW2011_GWA2_42_11]KKT76491.1 MAG: hypothetical protein UW72_C0005G0059 [Parcubacteria group bacterium GW2011_GWF2_44_7]
MGDGIHFVSTNFSKSQNTSVQKAERLEFGVCDYHPNKLLRPAVNKKERRQSSVSLFDGTPLVCSECLRARSSQSRVPLGVTAPPLW